MAMRQTDSEPPVEESPAEDTAEYSAESQRGKPRGKRGSRPATGYAAAVRTEQAYVTMLYGLLDQARERSELELASVRAQGGAGGTHQARLERDVSSAEHEKRITQLNLTERGLCFGRVDDEQRLTLYIGRIGLRDDDYDLKLIDWRAPAARPFYAATPRSPQGLVRRRHIYTRLRQVTGVDDEVFDLDKLSDSDRATLSGEAALIAAVSSARTGRMADVVATIQAEQDRVIRADLPGVLVVQGGPGTGKTVAALHRAAYLLYTHRRTLERRGVLVIGPNATFLRYIGQVLPSLGETDVVLHTLGDLFPGVRATDTRDPAAVVKGDERMVRVLQQAVRDRQRAPRADLDVDADRVRIPLRREAILRARDRARSTRKPHNVARKLFVTELLNELARGEARVLDRPFDDEDLPVRPRAAVVRAGGGRRARRAVAPAHPGKAAGRAAEVARRDPVRRRIRPPRYRTVPAFTPGPPRALDGGRRPAARRARRAARRRRLGRQGRAPRARARPAPGDAVRPGGARVDRRGRPRPGRRRDAGRLEPRQRPRRSRPPSGPAPTAAGPTGT